MISSASWNKWAWVKYSKATKIQFVVCENVTSAHLVQIVREKSWDYLLTVYKQKSATSFCLFCVFWQMLRLYLLNRLRVTSLTDVHKT